MRKTTLTVLRALGVGLGFKGMVMSDFEREAFEATAQEKWPQYSLLTDKCGAYSEVFLQGAWEGWQSACSQGGEVEPVAWDDPAVDPIVSKLYKKFKDWSQRGFTADDVTWCEVRGYVAELLNTHPPAPTQAPVDNEIPELDSLCAKYNNGEIDLCALVCRIWNTASTQGVPKELAAHIRRMIDLHENRGVVLRVHMQELQELLESAPNHPSGEWVRCDERLPTEADAGCDGSAWFTDKSGDGVQMDPILMHWSYVTKGSGHWMPTGLKRPQPPQRS